MTYTVGQTKSGDGGSSALGIHQRNNVSSWEVGQKSDLQTRQLLGVLSFHAAKLAILNQLTAVHSSASPTRFTRMG